MLKAGVMNAD
ncbi:glycogen synthase domain protein, partial [Vibrio parahaemolyticus V-223/04]